MLFFLLRGGLKSRGGSDIVITKRRRWPINEVVRWGGEGREPFNSWLCAVAVVETLNVRSILSRADN